MARQKKGTQAYKVRNRVDHDGVRYTPNGNSTVHMEPEAAQPLIDAGVLVSPAGKAAKEPPQNPAGPGQGEGAGEGEGTEGEGTEGEGTEGDD